MRDFLLDIANALNFSNPHNWLIVAGVALAVGLFCLRGYHNG